MMNDLMTVLMGKHDVVGRDDNFPSAFNSISFKYRQLGVNAEANNYAFANECYSQWTMMTPNSRGGGSLVSQGHGNTA